MKVAVAGSTGLVGSAVARYFAARGADVIEMSRAVVDLLDRERTIEFIRDCRPDLVVDAAAKVGGIGANMAFPVEFLHDNLRIQGNLMEAAHLANVHRFVFLASSCVYPRDCPQPIKEEYLMTGPLEPTNSAYALAKISGIELIRSYRREYGHQWISLMPTNLYGPGDNFNLATSHVLPALIRKFVEAKENSTVTLWGTGKPLREFLHVDDLAAAVALCSEHYETPDLLNVGTGLEISIADLAKRISEQAGFKGDIVWDSAKPDGTPQKVLDINKIQSLGWAPKLSLEEGIRSTIDWYRVATSQGLSRR